MCTPGDKVLELGSFSVSKHFELASGLVRDDVIKTWAIKSYLSFWQVYNTIEVCEDIISLSLSQISAPSHDCLGELPDIRKQ